MALMPVFRMPIFSLTAPPRGPFCRLSELSELPIAETPSFDFRAPRFDVDARTLARVTGCSLVACRQQLFMAEGDMGLAHMLLVSGYDAQEPEPTLH